MARAMLGLVRLAKSEQMAWARRLFARRRDTAVGIYGTVVATSIAAGLSQTRDLTPAQAMEILAAGQIVLWLAHIYARFLARDVDRSASALRGFVVLAVYEWPMLRACVPAAAAIGLWWAGAVSEDSAYWLAVLLGVGELVTLGFVIGRRAGQTVVRATATAAVGGGLGALVVLAKVITG